MKNKKIKALSKWLEERGYKKETILNPYGEGYIRKFYKNGFGISLIPLIMKIEGKEKKSLRVVIYGNIICDEFSIVSNRVTLKAIKGYIKRVNRYDRNNIRRINNNERNNTK